MNLRVSQVFVSFILGKPEAGDFSYCGVHDQGLLPSVRSCGLMALLIGCVERAQLFNDEYLTGVIVNRICIEDDGHQVKKVRID
jgi:hypothetical protein